MKARKMITKCMLSIVLVFTGVQISCSENENDAVFIPNYDVVPKYTEADIDVAYEAFNTHLYDPVRKIYYRDSGKPSNVGAIWTQAIYWDMAMNAYKRKKTPENLKRMEDLYEGNAQEYANYDWSNAQKWFIYDDIMWWVISMARAYDLTNDAKYLTHAETGFARVWSGSDVVGDGGSYDPVSGGMYWQWDQQNPSKPKTGDGKMACINFPTVVAAATLYKVTKKQEYLDKAKEIYKWASENLFDPLTGRIADSKHGDNTPDWSTTVYNQGSAIGAATELYVLTKEQSYLDQAILIADYTKDEMSKPYSVLPFATSEEQGVYTAIFAQYIVRLIEVGQREDYLPWLRRTIDYGWSNRDVARNLTGKDYLSKVNGEDVVSCYDASGIPALMLLIPSIAEQ